LIACDPDTSYTKNNKLFTYTAIAIGLHYSRGFATRTGALNPAVAVMTEIVQSLVDLNYKYLINFYIFLIGPFGGGFLAGLFFKKVWKP
jgi:glycerol uptake facilitator-like aquaporin